MPRQCGHELSCRGIKAIDGPRIVHIVGDQQRVAQGTEIPGRQRETPGLIKRSALRKGADERSAYGPKSGLLASRG